MDNDFIQRLRVDSTDEAEIRRQAVESAVESALLEKKNGREKSVNDIMEASSGGTLSLYGFLDSEKIELIERIGNDLKNGEISDEHFNYFKSYRNLTRFMDRYLARLHKTIESEPCGEIILAPDIDSEMESIMQEFEKDKENAIE